MELGDVVGIVGGGAGVEEEDLFGGGELAGIVGPGILAVGDGGEEEVAVCPCGW